MKKFYVFLSVVFFIFVFSITASARNVGASFTLSNGQEIQPVDKKVYLPAYSDITDLEVYFSSTFSNITFDGVTVDDGYKLDITKFKTTDANGNECYEITFLVGKSPDVYTVYKANNLSAVFLTTSLGKKEILENEKTDYGTKISIVNSDGSYEYADMLTNSQLRVRGNTTPYYAKKPFQMKFEKKADLFGMGEARTWILLANYLDQSLIRNALLYELAALGMHACEYRSVDVYLDGEYQGIYLLCEKVQIQENRLNITDMEKLMDDLNPTYSSNTVTVTSGDLIDQTIVTEYRYVEGVVTPDDITGGYLVELDNNRKGAREDASYFITRTNMAENYYVIKSPEYCSKEQVEYIARLFAYMEEAFTASDGINSLGIHYTEYIDIDSFAYAYIMAELGRNYDAGSASIFFYKDADVDGKTSKIFKGPLWDCDNTLGNILKNNAHIQTSFWAKNRTPWNALTQHDEFNAKVTEKFEQIYDVIYDMLDAGGYIDQQVEFMGDSVAMERVRWNSFNADKWPLYYDGYHYDTWNSITTFHSVSEYSDIINDTKNTTIGYLAYCLETRTNWLVRAWDCEVETRERELNVIYAELISIEELITFPAPENMIDDYFYRIIKQSVRAVLVKLEEVVDVDLV